MTSTTNANTTGIGASRSTVVNPEPIYLNPGSGEVDWYPFDRLAQAEPLKPELITRFGHPTHSSVAETGLVAVKKGRLVLFIQGRSSLTPDDLTTYVDQTLEHMRPHTTMARPVSPDDQKLSATAAPYATLYGYEDTELKMPATPSVGLGPIYEATTSFISELAHDTFVEDFIFLHVQPPQLEERSNSAEIRDCQNPLLLESIAELQEVTEYAADEGWPLPTPDSLARTESLLRRMFDIQPHRYWVYPTPEGELVIDGGYQDHRIIVTLPKEGGAIYTYTDPAIGQISAVECPDPQALPDRQMVEVLSRMGGGYGLACPLMAADHSMS